MGKIMKTLGYMLSAAALATLLACEQKLYESKVVDTSVPIQAEMRSGLQDIAEGSFFAYMTAAEDGKWPAARDALVRTLRAYNTLTEKYDDQEAKSRLHSMTFDGDETKLDAILQEAGTGSLIKMGDYELEIVGKDGGVLTMDGDRLDNAVRLRLEYKGRTLDLNGPDSGFTGRYNTTVNDIYLSDLAENSSPLN